jgi:hypothetical protein
MRRRHRRRFSAGASRVSRGKGVSLARPSFCGRQRLKDEALCDRKCLAARTAGTPAPLTRKGLERLAFIGNPGLLAAEILWDIEALLGRHRPWTIWIWKRWSRPCDGRRWVWRRGRSNRVSTPIIPTGSHPIVSAPAAGWRAMPGSARSPSAVSKRSGHAHSFTPGILPRRIVSDTALGSGRGLARCSEGQASSRITRLFSSYPPDGSSDLTRRLEIASGNTNCTNPLRGNRLARPSSHPRS